MKTLYTPRLKLRGFEEYDLEDFYEYAKNPAVGPAAGWKPHEDRAESKKIMHAFMESGEVWAIELRDTGKLVGSIGLHPDLKRPGVPAKMLGYVL